MQIAPGARAAITDRGLPGLLTAGGGSLQVALYLAGVEVSGGGYARQRVTGAQRGIVVSGAASASLNAVTFTATGGGFSYDELRVLNAGGSIAMATRSFGRTITVTAGAHSVTIRFGDKRPAFYDLTRYGQLSELAGPRPEKVYDQSHPYPYWRDDGTLIYQSTWDYLVQQTGQVSLDHEPYVERTYEVGSITVVNGIVTGSGTNFPAWEAPGWGYSRYPLRLNIGKEYYNIETRVSGTSLVLEDRSVNASAGTSYRYLDWLFRELDPHFADDQEWQFGLDEFAYAWDLNQEAATRNGAILGFYDLCCNLYRRIQDIIDDAAPFGDREIWQLQQERTFNYVTASGWSFKEKLEETGGFCWWNSYVDHDWIGSTTNWTRYRTRNTVISDTLEAIGVRNAPIFSRHTLLGLDQFWNTGTGEEVPRDFQRLLIEDAEARNPGNWSYWGIYSFDRGCGQYINSLADDYRDWLGETVREIRGN